MLQNPDLFLESKIILDVDDFPEKFHKIIFASIKNLYSKNSKKISPPDIEIFLSNYPEQYKIFDRNKGLDYLYEAIEFANLDLYEYYTIRIKKFTILRKLKDQGFNIKEIYDEDDEEKILKFDKLELEELIHHYNKKLMDIESCLNNVMDGIHVSNKVEDLLKQFEKEPEMGLLSGINGFDYVAFGLRKKYYLLSSASGYGKSRTLTYLAMQTGIKHNVPTLLITTELDYSEIQSMILSGLSNVWERKIILNNCNEEEKQKIYKAINKLKNSSLYIVHLPDYTIDRVEYLIKKYIITYGVEYVFFDYIKTTMSILQEINKKTGGGLQTWQILTLLSERLKSISVSYNVGMYTATQINNNYFSKDKNKDSSNQSMIAGSKSIIDFADLALIIRPATQKEIEDYQLDLCDLGKTKYSQHVFWDIYKNRRSLKDVSIGISCDLGMLRYQETVCIKNGNILEFPKIKNKDKEE